MHHGKFASLQGTIIKYYAQVPQKNTTAQKTQLILYWKANGSFQIKKTDSASFNTISTSQEEKQLCEKQQTRGDTVDIILFTQPVTQYPHAHTHTHTKQVTYLKETADAVSDYFVTRGHLPQAEAERPTDISQWDNCGIEAKWLC